MHRLGSRSSTAIRRATKSAKPVLARGAHKEIKFSNEGRASILAGVDVLAKAVSVTLGPKGMYKASFASHKLIYVAGRNVIIEQPFGGPKITKGQCPSFTPTSRACACCRQSESMLLALLLFSARA